MHPSPLVGHLFVLAAVVNSTYSFVWDILMDWGMLQWDRERGWWKPALRETRLISQTRSVYGLVALFNCAMRFLWAMAVFGYVRTRGQGMFFFEAMEIVRRTVWAVFRIEWEYVNKVLPRREASIASAEKDSTDGEESGLLPARDSSDRLSAPTTSVPRIGRLAGASDPDDV